MYAGWRVFQDKCAGCHGSAATGTAGGLLRISAGNYGGKLGPFHFHLRKLLDLGGGV